MIDAQSGPRILKDTFQLRKLNVPALKEAPKGFWHAIQTATHGDFRFSPTTMKAILEEVHEKCKFGMAAKEKQDWKEKMSEWNKHQKS